jgi:hypothetical protein
VPRVGGVGVAERARELGLLDTDPGQVADQRDHDEGERADPAAQGQADAEGEDERSGVRRMSQPAVRAFPAHRLPFLDRHVASEETPETPDRPRAQRDAEPCDRDADGKRVPAVRVRPERRHALRDHQSADPAEEHRDHDHLPRATIGGGRDARPSAERNGLDKALPKILDSARRSGRHRAFLPQIRRGYLSADRDEERRENETSCSNFLVDQEPHEPILPGGVATPCAVGRLGRRPSAPPTAA